MKETGDGDEEGRDREGRGGSVSTLALIFCFVRSMLFIVTADPSRQAMFVARALTSSRSMLCSSARRC